MKNLRKIVLLLLSLTLMFGLFACGGSDPCTECTDSDGDGKCDVCGGKVEKEPCTECTDSDGDGKCDVCGEDVTPAPASDVALIEDGAVKFQIVLGKNISTDVRKAATKDIQAVMRNKYKLEVKVVDEGSSDDTPQDIEVLIGDITTRGDEYKFDRYTLGKDGYIIKIIGTKILLQAGSDETLADTLVEFAEDILGLGEKTLKDVTMTADMQKDKPQTDYKVTLSVNGTPMNDYTIAVDKTNTYLYNSALALQDGIYDRAGYYLKIVTPQEATDKSVVIESAAKKVYGNESFAVKADGTKLIISTSFLNATEEAVAQFMLKKITLATGEVDFKGTVYTEDISVVYYEDFGAKGDGETDDFLALYLTHKFANECGQKVLANKNDKPYCCYYIKETIVRETPTSPLELKSIVIQTNVDWRNAEFIIDDREVLGDNSASIPSDLRAQATAAIFNVTPNEEHEATTLDDPEALRILATEGINPSTTRINIHQFLDGWTGEVMIMPYNSSHKVYRRKGYGGYDGAAQHEVIVINPDGTVSEETPIMFEYTNLSYITVYRIDKDAAITIENGKVTTRACTLNMVYFSTVYNENRYNGTYIYRNLSVKRSYTTVKNVDHYVTDEFTLAEQVKDGKIAVCGASYNGFYAANSANHITFEDCIITGRRCYRRPEDGTQGTYELSAANVNKIVFDNCQQHNFWVTVDPDTLEITPATADTPNARTSMSSYTVGGFGLNMHWGVGGTNFCKNMEYLNSTLSRYDAHQGLYHGKIINSTVNYLELTGNGEFIFEDSTWYQSSSAVAFMALRADYGYTWDGTIKIKNSRAFINSPNNVTTKIFLHSYSNWYYGYTCAVPNLEIDNLMYYDIEDVTGDKVVPQGTRIDIIQSVRANTKFHLADAGVDAIWSITDADEDGYIDEPNFDRDLDGFIDEPTDLDGDGKIGNTSLKFEDYHTGLDADWNGVTSATCTVNLNMIRPPEYIKIINNEGGYIYNIVSTAGQGISDGGWYRSDGEQDTLGGFWGGTKFIYGEGETDFFKGSGHKSQKVTATFRFY